jgi:hypothetical protein
MPFEQPSSPGARKPSLIGAGALVLVAGIVAGVVLFLASSSNYDDGVTNLARAPIGCTTSLQFDEAGTYTIYVETVGVVGEMRGDCPNADTDYDFGDGEPDVDVVLVDDNGDEVDLDDDDSKSYDAAGFVGQSIASVQIEDAGDFEISVSSDDEDFAIAVGRNPKETADSTKSTAIIALAAGVVIGAVLILLGMRRKPSTPAMPGGQPPASAMTAQAPSIGYQAPQYASPPMQQPPVQAPPVQMPPAQAPPIQSPPPGGTNWPAPPS